MADALMVRRWARRSGAWALVIAALLGTPAHADLYTALSVFKQGNYPSAFQDFLALAKLGQPLAQVDVAYLYAAGVGTPQSSRRAYAWAVLAGQNAQAKGAKLAAKLRPVLSPAAERAAARIVARYSPDALRRRLLPVAVGACGGSHSGDGADSCPFDIHTYAQCNPVHFDRFEYPMMQGITENMQSQLVVRFTLMPDGTARLPHVVFGLPEPAFRPAVRATVLRSKFKALPPGTQPVQCEMEISFLERDEEDLSAYPQLELYLFRERSRARRGDPRAEAVYGTLLAGLPQVGRFRGRHFLQWLVKAAQAGVPYAQYEVGESLISGWGCRPDEAKGLRWLKLAAAQNEPRAETALAARLLRRPPDPATMATARQWLEAAVAQHEKSAALYLSALLAAAPEARDRDPARALRLEKEAFAHPAADPTGYEIRAAAYAAEGHFAHAVDAEQEAIAQARRLGWSLAPLQTRLARYRAGKPWFGNLINLGTPISERPIPPCAAGKCLSRVSDGKRRESRPVALVGHVGQRLERLQRRVDPVLG